MTKKQAKELLPIITAFAEGKTVQRLSGNLVTWLDVHDPDWSCNTYHYRIKPTPTLRPWKPEEVPVGALFKEDKEGYGTAMILSVNSQRGLSYIHNGEIKYKQLTMLGRAAISTDHGKTWHPCGVMEE